MSIQLYFEQIKRYVDKQAQKPGLGGNQGFMFLP